MQVNWRAPNTGPWLHGIAVFLLTEGYPITKYVYQAVLDRQANPDASFNWDFFFLGLAATAVAVFISVGRNQGAVSLTKDEAFWVKGAQAAAGPRVPPVAVLAAAHEVVANDEPVIVLRGRPPMPPDLRDPRVVAA